jgi:hypothetical protein
MPFMAAMIAHILSCFIAQESFSVCLGYLFTVCIFCICKLSSVGAEQRAVPQVDIPGFAY